jgi:hypothetical protein
MFLYSIIFYRFIIACLLLFEQKAEAPSGKIYVLRAHGKRAEPRASARNAAKMVVFGQFIALSSENE